MTIPNSTPPFDAQPCYTVGIDLGGTNLRIAAYSGASLRLDSVSIRTRSDHGPAAVLQDIADAAAAMQRAHAAHGKFMGYGIGSPGPIELPAGKLLAPANLPGFDQLKLKDELEMRLQSAVIVESDANAAALAEWHLGAGRAHGTDSMAMVTLGTGVGGGLVLNRKIWHGAKGMACEPGHTIVAPEGMLCNCGTRGCLELYASATAVRRMAIEAALAEPESALGKAHKHGDLHAHRVAELARAGDAAAIAIFRTVGETLGCGLGALVSTLNLSLYTIGGGLAQAWDLFAPAMFQSLEDASQVYRLTKPASREQYDPCRTNVCHAHLGPEAGILGASLLPFFQ